MVLSIVPKMLGKVFGTRNDRLIKRYGARVEKINSLETETRKLTDAELKAKTVEFQQRIEAGERAVDLQPDALAVAREVMDRSVGIRNIFNPEHAEKFPFDKLSPDMQKLYEELKAKMEATEPIATLGSIQHPSLHHLWDPTPGWQQVEVPNAMYEAVRELFPHSRPPFRARPFDVQLIGGMVLSEGRIAEMKTGEGKTIVAPLACFLACLEQLQCHVVTVNDYLVQRDRDWVFPFYQHAGLTVGTIHPTHMQPHELKAQAYSCDVLYGTNSELGFDYLRDNMKLSLEEQVQKTRDFCIIDEVDSILIDEARTPLIISGTAHDDAPRYKLADQLARHLVQKQSAWTSVDKRVKQCEMKLKALEGDIRNARDKEEIPKMREEMTRIAEQELPAIEADRDQHTQYYEVEPEKKAAHLTHEGIAEAQKVANVGSFFVGNNMDMPHLLENALRAHVIYLRDKEYVVQGGEVIIVDENTGRLMEGRQWSDGLHQAVESKERVEVKEETQTLATVTIQNFFKLYKRLAGMTGTAITEATEFDDIYKLDVVCIPTNVPVVRDDRNDLIYLSAKDKWYALLDEIKLHHDVGRPVLVGTTSVEKSEMLAEMLRKRHGIQHEVLNAKQHEREANIVENAGKLGAVMIATNMAGRGTDIKLSPIDREELVHHWQQRNLLPKQAKADMPDDELINLSFRHMAQTLIGMKKKEIDAVSDENVKLGLLQNWVTQQSEHSATMRYVDPDAAAAMPEDACMSFLDNIPGFALHRLEIFKNIESMGGLHIVGTERHESRRIDNQLRGRAGRQGDQGSSRFFISLEDELMRNFAGPIVLKTLSRLGMKEGDAIEHKWITKSVERAQRKVEERNFEQRKSLVEYDEVMELQRSQFYEVRQHVLEGKEINDLVFDYIGNAVDDAVSTYLDKDYVPNQIADWCLETVRYSVEASKLHTDDLNGLQAEIRADAKADASMTIETALGEYVSDDIPVDDWDFRGLSSWAMSKFDAHLTQNQLRRMSIKEIHEHLVTTAYEQIEKKDLSGLTKFLEPFYAQKSLSSWAHDKFGIELDAEALSNQQIDDVTDLILEKAREAYAKREVTYPAEFALEMAFATAEHDGDWAAEQLCKWVKRRYDLDWTTSDITDLQRGEMKEKLVNASEEWLRGGKLETLIDQAVSSHSSPEDLATWASERFGKEVTTEDLKAGNSPRDELLKRGHEFLRQELSQLERFVLLQILDSAWKDHLYAMDQLRDSVGVRSVTDKEKDPRVVYKMEGASQFREMQRVVRDRVTDLIFHARLTPQVEMRNVYSEQEAQHEEAGSILEGAAARAGGAGTAQQQADIEAADRAGGRDDSNMSRKQRRAAVAEARRKGGGTKRRR